MIKPKLDTAREMIEFASQMSEFVFGKEGKLNPIWHAIQADGEQFMFPAPEGDGSRDDMFNAIAEMFRIQNVVRYYAVAEGYVIETKADFPRDELERIKDAGLENHPASMRVVIIHSEDENGVIVAHRRIVRSDGGQAHLGPLEYHDSYSTIEGGMIGLLRHLRPKVLH